MPTPWSLCAKKETMSATYPSSNFMEMIRRYVVCTYNGNRRKMYNIFCLPYPWEKVEWNYIVDEGKVENEIMAWLICIRTNAILQFSVVFHLENKSPHHTCIGFATQFLLCVNIYISVCICSAKPSLTCYGWGLAHSGLFKL